MAAVVEASERVNKVQIEGLALLKIVKHCHESLPHMVKGSLLGLVVENGVLEITHSFPFPDQRSSNSQNVDKISDAEGDVADLEGADFELEMMRMLREVNVDNNCVGWYQSMYLGIYSTSSLLENQLSYQTDLSPNAVVLLYDPMQTAHGNLVLKCLRLTDECIKIKTNDKNSFIEPNNIFEEIPVQLTNPGLVQALLTDVADDLHTDLRAVDNTTFDRLDLSTNPYLEKHLEFLCGWVDDLSSEQQKFQYYSRQLARDGRKGNKATPKKEEATGTNPWESSDAPRRMESLLISNQIRSYCDQMNQFSSGGLSKLYAMGGLHKKQEDRPASSSS